MSGILLPGQENKPKSDEQPAEGSASGLVLPSGFSSKKERENRQENAPENKSEPTDEGVNGSLPAVTNPATAPQNVQPTQDSQPQMNFKYPPSGAQVQCPSCGTPFNTAVFSMIDLGANPELLSPLLSGQVNAAICSNCGAGGQLSAPLLIHHAANNFLGVFVPSTGQVDDVRTQKTIGDLTSRLMRDLPSEERKGYLLTPKQFFDWGKLIEVLWGFEGVTPEMLRRNADQRALLQSLMKLANDDSALKIGVERSGDLIDLDFFGMLEQMVMAVSQQGQQEAAQNLLQLREKLIETTPAGEEVKKQQERAQALLEKISQTQSREELLTLVVNAWGEENGQDIVGSVAAATGPAFDYEFVMLLAAKIEATKDDEERTSLEDLRDLLVQIQSERQQNQQSAMQQVQALLQEVLQAEDPEAFMRQYTPAIDQTFLALIAANVKSAREQNATAAVNRLEQIYTIALQIFDESLPPEIHFMQELVGAPDANAVKKLLNEKRDQLTPDFVNMLGLAENQMRESGHNDQADKIKSIRGQVALMV